MWTPVFIMACEEDNCTLYSDTSRDVSVVVRGCEDNIHVFVFCKEHLVDPGFIDSGNDYGISEGLIWSRHTFPAGEDRTVIWNLVQKTIDRMNIYDRAL